MLLPFPTIQYPAGKLADKIGEKKFLTIGFFIMAIALYWFAKTLSGTVFVFAIILFLSRVGASLAEVMVETYFFKQVNEEDVGSISLFRNMRSVAFILGPLSATFLVAKTGIHSLFFVLSAIMLVASICAMMLNDTKHA